MQEIDFTNCEEYGMTIRDSEYIKTKENERCNEEEIRTASGKSDKKLKRTSVVIKKKCELS